MTFCSRFVSPFRCPTGRAAGGAGPQNPNTRCCGKHPPPCLLWTCCLDISFEIPRPFSRHNCENSLLPTFSFCHLKNATSGTSTLCHLPTSRSPRPFNLPPHKSHPRTWASLLPCCSSPTAIIFWSSNGCIFICISYVFGVSASWQKGDTDDSASHGAHTDVCICSHATEGECALQVHLPLMYVLSAVGLFSSELKWFSI